MGTFVDRKKRKIWRRLAVGRASRRIAAWVLGRRGAAITQRSWQALPLRYRRHYWYFTDLRSSCVGILPRWYHRYPKGSGSGTSIVEIINYSLRKRYAHSAKILLLQQIAEYAYRPNYN